MDFLEKSPNPDEVTFEYLFSSYEQLWPLMVEEHPVLEQYLNDSVENRMILRYMRYDPKNTKGVYEFIKLSMVALRYAFEPLILDYLMENYPDTTAVASIRVVDQCRKTLQLHQPVYQAIVANVTTDVLVESSVQMEELNVKLFETLQTPPEVVNFIQDHINRPNIRVH